MKNKTITSVYFPNDLVKLVTKRAEKNDTSFSKELINLVRFALKIEEYKPKVKDPEWLRTFESIKQRDDVIEWLQSLPDDAVAGMKMGAEMELQKRQKLQSVYR